VDRGGAAGECARVFPPLTLVKKTEKTALLSVLVLSDINSACHMNEELLLHTTQTYLCPEEGASNLIILPPDSAYSSLVILNLFAGIYVM